MFIALAFLSETWYTENITEQRTNHFSTSTKNIKADAQADISGRQSK